MSNFQEKDNELDEFMKEVKREDDETLLKEIVKQKFEDMEIMDGVEFTPEEAELAGFFKEIAVNEDEL